VSTACRLKFFCSRILICLFAVCILSAVALPVLGQESYRTQQALRPQPNSTSRQSQPVIGSESSGAPKVTRFLGWRDAERQGPSVVRHFQGLMRRPRPVPRNRSGYAPAIPKAAKLPLVSPSSSLSTSLPGIQLRPSLPAGALPSDVVTGDFNGDGKLDWAVANAGDNTLTIYLGNGDDTSQLPIIVPLLGQSPVAIAAGDLNADGKIDLVVVETDSNTVGILFGNGDGTFQQEIEIPIVNAQPMGIAIADLNKDGHPDLIIGIRASITGPTFSDFEVMLGEGSGNFGAPIISPPFMTDGLNQASAFSVADMNGDGILDLLVTGADAFSSTTKTYFGKGDGSFTAGALVWRSNPEFGNNIGVAILADLNGDGCPDVALPIDLGWVNTFINDCKGNFPSTPDTYGMPDTAFGLAVADINGDGHPDLITGAISFNVGLFGSIAGDGLSVRLNDGTGKFGPARVYRGEAGMVALVAADLKGDGHPSIISVNQDTNSVTVFANDGAGGFGLGVGGYDGFLEGVATSPTNAPASADVVADVDGDGKPDLVLMERSMLGSFNNMGTVAVMLNQGSGKFGAPIRSPMVSENAIVLDFVLADFRKTGQLDFVAFVFAQTDTGGPALLYAQNIGNGQFGAPVTLPLPSAVVDAFGTVAVGDFNNDGKLDIAVATPVDDTSDELLVYLGNGDGTFKSPSQTMFASGAEAQAIFVGDANSDGKQDIFVWLTANGGIGTGLYEFLGNGDGTLQAGKKVLSTVSQMTMADLNHDGLLDIIDIESDGSNGVPGGLPPTISIFLGKPNGDFSAPTTYTPYSGDLFWATGVGLSDNISKLFAPYLGDFDGDGNLDFAVYQQNLVIGGPSYVQFMKGNGDGTFTPTFDIFQLGIQPVPELSAFNLFGDGRSSLLQTPAFSSGYEVIPAGPPPSFQIEMDEIPVLSGKDAIEISLNVPSSSNTVITLSASDANVQIPASATVPAGQLFVQVPFTLAANFPTNHWFSITGQSGSTSAIAYNFPLSAGLASPFILSITGGFAPRSTGNFSSPAPGESSIWNTNLTSTGVGTSDFQMTCSGLPTKATCTDFTPQSFLVEPGAINGNTFMITTDPTIAPGQYPFTVTASDGFASISSSAVLQIGDFSISLSPTSVTGTATGTANFTLTTTLDFGYNEILTLTCSGLPSGATCASQGQSIQAPSQPFVVNLASVPGGTYDFNVSATNGAMLTHSTGAQLQIPNAAFASLNQSTVLFTSLLVGQSSTAQAITLTNTGNAPLNLTSIAAAASSGASKTFTQTNTCGTALGPNLSCTITPAFSPSAVGSFSGTVTVTSNATNSPQVISLSGAAADFSFQTATGGSTSVTITAGQPAIYNLQIQGNQLNGSITLSCSGAPPQSSCTVSPTGASFTPGAAPIPLQVQVATRLRTSTSTFETPLRLGGQHQSAMLIVLSLSLVSFVALFCFKQRGLRYGVGVFAILAALTILPCCGGGGTGGGGNTGTPAGTYTITVTGQINNGTRTIALTLVVK
jgi:hypothetical protein